MKVSYLIAALAAALPIHVVHAQDAPDPVPRAPAADGLRVEALIGADYDGNEHGMVYGGRLGYDLRVAPRLLLGIDAEANGVTTEQALQLPPPTGRFALQDGPDYYLGGRATFALSSRVRLHGGVGFTRARHASFFFANGFFGGEQSFHDGYRVSAGGQFSLGRHAFLGAEYRYSSYEDGFFQREQWVGSLGFRF